MNYKKAKIIVALFLLCCLLFFTSDFQLIDIEKTAIIAAIGVDYVDNELEVTAQIAIPQASDTTSTNSDTIISSKGKTLFEAIDKIATTTGWYPKLAFCNLIIFGNELVKQDFLPLVEYMMTSDRFQNSAILAAAEGTAKEILSSVTPLDFISSFALEKILVRNIDRSNTVMVTDIREFAAFSKSRSGFAYLPLVKSVKTDDKEKGDSADQSGGENDSQKSGSEAAGKMQQSDIEKTRTIDQRISKKSGYKSIIGTSQVQGGGGSGKGGSGGEGKGSTIYDASCALLFSNGKLAGELNSDQTLCYNFLTESVSEAFIPVSYKQGGKTINSVVAVTGNKPSIKLEVKNGLPKLKISLTLTCETEEKNAEQSVLKLTESDVVSLQAAEALEKDVKQTLQSIADTASQINCDVFRLREYLYRHNPKNYASLKDVAVTKVETEITVKCKNFK